MAKKTEEMEVLPAEIEKEAGVSSINKISVKALRVVMEAEAEKRTLLTQFISHHMKEGADYGTIKIGGRDSKPSLFKPGSEKFLSLFKLTARFDKDVDTWEMAGSEFGIFAYTCTLLDSKGNVVGEGRGVATMKEKAWSMNTCVKIAEKRAQIDAVLRTGALSDFFTQDLEDMARDSEPMKPYRTPRIVPDESDEAQGHRTERVIQTKDGNFEYPKMTAGNDASGLPKEIPSEVVKDSQIIKELLSELGKPATSQKEAIMNIGLLTGGLKDGLKWKPGKNDSEVIESLRKLNLERMNNEALDKAVSGE